MIENINYLIFSSTCATYGVPKNQKIDEKKLNILDIPIVTYCEKKECDASSKLLEHLIDSGFTNVLEYPGGNVEYKNKSNKGKLSFSSV